MLFSLDMQTRVRFRNPRVLEEAVFDVEEGLRYLESLGVRAFGVVGHSFGGAVALQARWSGTWDLGLSKALQGNDITVPLVLGSRVLCRPTSSKILGTRPLKQTLMKASELLQH